MFISNPSIVDCIALRRHELKLTVFAFVFCIYAVRIYRAMKAYLPTLPVFPGVSKFFMKSPGDFRLEHQISRELPTMALFTFRIH